MIKRYLIYLFAFSNFCIQISSQEITYNQEFKVNTHRNWYNYNPCISGLAEANFVICWRNDGQDGSEEGIYGQLFSASAQRLGNEFKVSAYSESQQMNPCITDLSDKNILVCWEHGDLIYGRLCSSSGAHIGDEFQVNKTNRSYQGNPCAARLTDDKLLVCWEANGQDGYGIYGQLFSKSGVRIGQEFRVNTYSQSQQSNSCITGLADNKFIICWQGYHQGENYWSIYGQIYMVSKDNLLQEYQENFSVKDHVNHPSVTSLGGNKFIICWQNDEYNIYGQIYNTLGEPINQEFKVNTSTRFWQAQPCVARLTDGKFFICWNSFGDNGQLISGQLYNDIGERVGQEFQISDYASNQQDFQTVAGLSNAGLIICWEGIGRNSTDYGIYGKYYLADPIEHILRSFQLREPQNDEYINTLIPSFYWQAVSDVRKNFPWELTYDLYIATNNNFTDIILFDALQDTVFTIPKGNLSPGTTYYWKVLARNIQGDSLWSSNTNGFYVDPNATDIETLNPEAPLIFSLEQNYPNPFNPMTTIPIILAEQCRVTVKVYNIVGQVVTTLARDQVYSAGRQLFVFDSNGLAAGVYFVRSNIVTTKGEQYNLIRKMLMIK